MRLLHDPKDAAKQIHQGARWRVPCAGDPGRVELHWSADLRGGGVEGRQSTGRREGKEGSLRLGGGGGGRFFLVGVAAARGAKVGGVAVVVGLEPTNPLSKSNRRCTNIDISYLEISAGEKKMLQAPPFPTWVVGMQMELAGFLKQPTGRLTSKPACKLQQNTNFAGQEN